MVSKFTLRSFFAATSQLETENGTEVCESAEQVSTVVTASRISTKPDFSVSAVSTVADVSNPTTSSVSQSLSVATTPAVAAKLSDAGISTDGGAGLPDSASTVVTEFGATVTAKQRGGQLCDESANAAGPDERGDQSLDAGISTDGGAGLPDSASTVMTEFGATVTAKQRGGQLRDESANAARPDERGDDSLDACISTDGGAGLPDSATVVPVGHILTIPELLSRDVLPTLSPSSHAYFTLQQVIQQCQSLYNDSEAAVGQNSVGTTAQLPLLSSGILFVNSNVPAEQVHAVISDSDNHDSYSPPEQKRQCHSLPSEKRYYCLFCEKPYVKIKAHLSSQHSDTKEVAEMMSKDNNEMQKYLVRLRNLGNHRHNCEVIRAHCGSLAVVYTPQSGPVPVEKADEYVPCPECYGYYERRQLWRHCKHRCLWKLTNDAASHKAIARGTILLPVPQYICKQTHEILCHMRKDEVYQAVINDCTIMEYAHRLTNKHYSDVDKHEHVRCKLREIGRLLIQLRTDHGIQSIAAALDPKYFQNVVNSVRKVAGFCDVQHRFATPSLALKLGHSVKKCAMILVSAALQSASREVEEKANAFMRLCEIDWSHEVSSSALTTLKDKKLNSTQILPLTEDISKFHDFLRTSVTESIAVLQSTTHDSESKSKAWLSLTQLVLAQLILFNRRRVGEVSKMTTANFQAVNKIDNSDICQHLSPLERKLCSSLSRVEVIGKRGNHVPILLTAAFKTAINIIVDQRATGCVPETNTFVFAKPHSDGHIRGCDVMRKYASDCGAKLPDALRGTQLRKHVATISQILNLKENELDILAQFMGHDVRVHREYYRLPYDVLQTAKVSKLLVAMESGQLSIATGQSLDEIDINFNEGCVTSTKELMFI